MKTRLNLKVFGTLFLLALTAGVATASPMLVANHSFEMLPDGGLPFLCGGNCAYSIDAIPGWTNSEATGQWITGGFAGNPGAIDGNVLAYSNYGSIWQDIGPAVAGVTYTLHVERLHRTDLSMAGEAWLEIGGIPVSAAFGLDGGPGSWNNWTAVYTPTSAEAGKTITILLSNNFGADEADFDNIRLDNNAIAAPEPASILMLGAGIFSLMGFYRSRKRLASGTK